jgi:hypothetical protein
MRATREVGKFRDACHTECQSYSLRRSEVCVALDEHATGVLSIHELRDLRDELCPELMATGRRHRQGYCWLGPILGEDAAHHTPRRCAPGVSAHGVKGVLHVRPGWPR